MIDLDDQLAAYSRYLDSAEQETAGGSEPPHPVPVIVTAEPVHPSRRRWISAAAAAAVVAIGGAALFRVLGDDGAAPGTPADPPWQLVTDDDAGFVPPPVEAPAPTRGGVPVTNTVEVTDVAATSYGLLAVGNETVDQREQGVLWRSADGIDWARVPLTDVVNSGTFTGAAGPGLAAISERDGRVVIAGQHSTYVSDDLETWERGSNPSGPYLEDDVLWLSIAAGPAGFVAVGSGGAWYSADGRDWEQTDSAGFLALHHVIFGGDQFVAVGVDGQGGIVATSADGQSWERQALPSLSRIDNAVSDSRQIALQGDVIVAVGTSWTLDDDLRRESSELIAWRSDDGGSTWTAIELPQQGSDERYGGVALATEQEFIVFGNEVGGEGEGFELRSPDGIEWTEHPIELPGYRRAATAFGDGAVAVGQAGPMLGAGSAEPPPSAVDGMVAAPPSTTVSVWTLGLS